MDKNKTDWIELTTIMAVILLGVIALGNYASKGASFKEGLKEHLQDNSWLKETKQVSR